MTGISASDLRELLRTAFRERLEPSGWEMLEGEDNRHRLVALRYGLGDEFAATTEVRRAGSVPDRPPVLVTSVFVGLSYEPLRRLWPLLDLYDISVLDECVWPYVSDEDDDEDDETEPAEEPLEVKTARDAERAADQLAPRILERAVPFAESYGNIDRLVAWFSGDRSPTPHCWRLAVASTRPAKRSRL